MANEHGQQDPTRRAAPSTTVPATQSELLPEHDGGQNGVERPFLVLSMALPDSVDGIQLGHAIAPVLPAPA